MGRRWLIREPSWRAARRMSRCGSLDQPAVALAVEHVLAALGAQAAATVVVARPHQHVVHARCEQPRGKLTLTVFFVKCSAFQKSLSFGSEKDHAGELQHGQRSLGPCASMAASSAAHSDQRS